MQQSHIFPLLRQELLRLLNGYIQASALLDEIDTYVTPPQLGNRAGVLGAMVLAEQAYQNSKHIAAVATEDKWPSTPHS